MANHPHSGGSIGWSKGLSKQLMDHGAAEPKRIDSDNKVIRVDPKALRALKDGPVYFDRRELTMLLDIYGKHVSAGDWRDYAMDFIKDRALFSVYRRNSEQPLYVIEKQPRLRNKQGQYIVTNQAGRVLKRGHDLAQVLKIFEPHLALVK